MPATKPKKKKWPWVVGVIAFLFVVSRCGASADDGSPDATATDRADQETSAEAAAPTPLPTEEVPAEQPAEPPIVVTAAQLLGELDANPLAAANTYEGKRVTVTGALSTIDASGDYFSLLGSQDDFSIQHVQCFIDESHLDAVMGFTMGQQVTVTGTISDVGEIIGYSLDVESIG